MPVYEYGCEEGHTFQLEQKITQDPVEKCIIPVGGSVQEGLELCEKPVKRLLFPAMVNLKGGGWARDGYAKKGSK